MDSIQNIKSRFGGGDSDDYKSEATLNSSDQSMQLDFNDVLGNPEVQQKGDPAKGRRYLFFNVIMIIFLSIIVISNAKDKNALDNIVKENLKEQQEAFK